MDDGNCQCMQNAGLIIGSLALMMCGLVALGFLIAGVKREIRRRRRNRAG